MTKEKFASIQNSLKIKEQCIQELALLNTTIKCLKDLLEDKLQDGGDKNPHTYINIPIPGAKLVPNTSIKVDPWGDAQTEASQPLYTVRPTKGPNETGNVFLPIRGLIDLLEARVKEVIKYAAFIDELIQDQ